MSKKYNKGLHTHKFCGKITNKFFKTNQRGWCQLVSLENTKLTCCLHHCTQINLTWAHEICITISYNSFNSDNYILSRQLAIRGSCYNNVKLILSGQRVNLSPRKEKWEILKAGRVTWYNLSFIRKNGI